MGKTRLEAFSDGVLAIIITIMVLELKVPHGDDLTALEPLLPVLLGYVVSFIYVGIYWNNHHHMLHAVRHVDGRSMWANLHLLFWLSLLPFVTGWVADNHAPLPTALYGVVLLMAGIAWLLLKTALIAANGRSSELAVAVGRDLKGTVSAVVYTLAIGLAFVRAWMAQVLYVSVALMWLVPDPRIERTVAAKKGKGSGET
jgi:uncharacterized membrane protein